MVLLLLHSLLPLAGAQRGLKLVLFHESLELLSKEVLGLRLDQEGLLIEVGDDELLARRPAVVEADDELLQGHVPFQQDPLHGLHHRSSPSRLLTCVPRSPLLARE
uniref:Secreted protein n=1 Tax=Chloropicon laureae TaxID=464258 RepID=A0A7S2YUD0_9CHLO